VPTHETGQLKESAFDDVVASLVLHYLENRGRHWPSFGEYSSPADG
jgi:hypothetical protein